MYIFRAVRDIEWTPKITTEYELNLSKLLRIRCAKLLVIN